MPAWHVDSNGERLYPGDRVTDSRGEVGTVYNFQASCNLVHVDYDTGPPLRKDGRDLTRVSDSIPDTLPWGEAEQAYYRSAARGRAFQAHVSGENTACPADVQWAVTARAIATGEPCCTYAVHGGATYVWDGAPPVLRLSRARRLEGDEAAAFTKDARQHRTDNQGQAGGQGLGQRQEAAAAEAPRGWKRA